MTSAGERLASAGINTSMLLSSDVTELKDVRLTNGIVLDLHNFMNKTKNCTYLTYIRIGLQPYLAQSGLLKIHQQLKLYDKV